MLLCQAGGLGCAKQPTRYETSFLDVFDTVTQVVLYADSQRAAQARFSAIHEELKTYHQLFDIYHNYPGIKNLKSINDAAGKAPVVVDAAILELVRLAKQTYALSDGRMNIAMGSVLSIWHDCREQGIADPEHAALPSMTLLTQAAAHTDISRVVVDEMAQTVYLTDPQLRLDVGGIAKGYAVELVAATAKADGVESLLISVGGNVRTIGVRGDGKPWKAAVQSPDEEGLLYTLNVSDMSLVTSGDYQRYYTVDGKNYHHIIDPQTRMPADYFSSVSVLCADSAMADALSTALFCMPLAQGQALIKTLPDTEAFWIAPDGAEAFSDGFLSYVVQ